jgi:hypothetical protein
MTGAELTQEFGEADYRCTADPGAPTHTLRAPSNSTLAPNAGVVNH